MTARSRQRWALSFADLCLLLAGFMVLLQAQSVDRARLSAGLRDAFHGPGPTPTRDEAATALFVAGEAVLLPEARLRLTTLGRNAVAHGHGLRVESRGTDGAGSRLDRWELAAARTTAVARVLVAGGVPERDIAVAIPALDATGADRAGQHLLIAERQRAPM